MTLAADNVRVRALIGAMRESVTVLGTLAALPEEDFLKDVHKIGSAKYNFITAIEAAIDMGNHLISRNRLRAPADYADTFQVLAEANVLDAEFALELMKMARFRNRLVHVYWRIEDRQVYAILRTKLDDFERFVRNIAAQLDNRQTGHPSDHETLGMNA